MTSEERTAYMLLSQYRSMASRVRELEERRTRCRSTPVGGGRTAHIGELYTMALSDATGKLEKIIQTIDRMGSEQHKRVLELRYIDGRSWTAIGERMHVSRTTLHRLHIGALKDFYSCYNP